MAKSLNGIFDSEVCCDCKKPSIGYIELGEEGTPFYCPMGYCKKHEEKLRKFTGKITLVKPDPRVQ